MNMFDLSIIVINFNTAQLTVDCIKSVVKNTKGIKYETIVVDNSVSHPGGEADRILSDSITRMTRSRMTIRLIQNKENLGFTGGNNQGIKMAKGRYVLLLNSDTLIHDNVFGEMVNWMDMKKEIGISTCALKNVDGSLQPTGGYFPKLLSVASWMTIQDLPFVDRLIKPFHPKIGYYGRMSEVGWVNRAFLLIRKGVIDKIGYLGE